MKIWQFSASGLLRGVSAAALAGAVVLGLGLPASATLIGDTITITSQANIPLDTWSDIVVENCQIFIIPCQM